MIKTFDWTQKWRVSKVSVRQYLIVSWHLDCTSIPKSFYKSKTCKEVTSPLEKIHIVSIFHFLTLSLWFFLQKQFFFWSNVLWKESNSKKVIFEIFRMGSHDEKEGTLVELWSLRKVKYPSLNLLCLLFQFSLYKNEKKSFRTSTGRQRFWLCLDLRREGFTTRVSWRWFHGRSDYLVNQNFPYNYVWDILMFRKTNYDRITRRSCQFNYYCIPSHINSIISCPNLLSVPDSYWQTTSSGDLVFLRRLEVGFFSEW